MGTLIVGIIVLCIIVLAAHKVYRDQKDGKGCGCGDCGGCSGCSASAAPKGIESARPNGTASHRN